MEHVERRRNYVQDIRKSFDNPTEDSLMDKKPQGIEGNSYTSFFKVRLLLSLFIFGGFVFCDMTDTKFYSHNTKDIVEQIQLDYDYANIENYVMMLTSKSKL